MIRIALTACLLAGSPAVPPATQPASRPAVKPLPAAHAHNDYAHRRPLLDALDHGFCSVESDIFLVGKQLQVAHTQLEVRPERTLESLYLEPLRARVHANGGRVYPGGPTLTLLIDLKTKGEPTYAELRKTLARYADILTSVQDGKVTPRAVTVILSGDAPRALLEAEPIRYAMFDGRLKDLDSPIPAHLMPLVSDNWKKVFTWRGEGPMPPAERARLRDLVDRAHRAGRKVRFWAAPDHVAVWKELRAAGVDLLSVDDLAGAEKFLLEEE